MTESNQAGRPVFNLDKHAKAPQQPQMQQVPAQGPFVGGAVITLPDKILIQLPGYALYQVRANDMGLVLEVLEVKQ